MADWPGAVDGQRMAEYGQNLTGNRGIVLLAPSVGNSKLTTFTVVQSSTAFDASGIFVSIIFNGSVARYLIDIAIGGAFQEFVIIPDILMESPYATHAGYEVFFPIAIPAGSRISARYQTSTASAACEIAVRITGAGFEQTPPRQIVQALGTTLASTAGQVLVGIVNAVPASYTTLNLVTYAAPATYSATVLGLAGLQGYWRMGESSGNLTDSSPGNSNTMVWGGGTTTYGVAGALNGDANTAISFTTTATSYFEAPNSTSLNVADTFSLVAWIKKSANGLQRVIISRGSAGYELEVNAANALQLVKSGLANCVASTVTITDTSWHMVAATKNGTPTGAKLYIDGADVTGAVSAQTMIATGGPTSIARYIGFAGYNWAGSIDEVAVFNRVLAPADITSLYQAGITQTITQATTVYPIEEVILCVQTPSAVFVSTNIVVYIRLLTGSTVIWTVPVVFNSVVLTAGTNYIGPIPMHIPAGSTIQAAYQANASTALSVQVMLYGVS